MRWIAGFALSAAALTAGASVTYTRYCTEDVCIERGEYAGIRIKDVTTYQTPDGAEHRIFRFDDGSVASLHLSRLPPGACQQSRAVIADVASGLAAGKGCLKSQHNMADIALSIVLRAADLDTVVFIRRAGFTLWRVGHDAEGNYHAFASEPVEVRLDRHAYLPAR